MASEISSANETLVDEYASQPPETIEDERYPMERGTYQREQLDNSQTSFMFFYDALAKPQFLKDLLYLKELPIMSPATVHGYKIKMCGPHPAAVKSSDPCDCVDGMLWEIDHQAISIEAFERVERYETYKLELTQTYAACQHLEAPQYCQLFSWKEDEDDSELRDVDFDLDTYLENRYSFKWKDEL